MAVGDVTVVEGDEGGVRRIRLPVTLAAPLPNEFTVRYDVTPGTASASEDFVVQRTSGTVRIPAGALRGHVEVIVLADTLAEDDESVLVTLSNPSAFTVSRSVGTLTILDDEEDDGGPGGPGKTIYAWGANHFGQFGNGTTIPSTSPVPGPAGTGWTQVAAGGAHACGVRIDGTLWCWGWNNDGQLGNGTATDSSVPVQEATGATDWTQVAAGSRHSCGIRGTGTLWCWGWNAYGELGDGTNNSSSVPVQVGTASDWTRVTADRHTCGIRGAGTLWCWGRNSDGQLGDGSYTDSNVPVQEASEATDWTQVAAGRGHSCGIRGTGTLWCWGRNADGELGDGSYSSSSVPVQVGTASDWTRVSAGAWVSCGIRGGGTLWCWGDNYYGQLGVGSYTDSNVPVQEATGATDWTRVVAGPFHSCGIRRPGTLWCWGLNVHGQLGNGTDTFSNVPVQEATAATDWTDIAVIGGGGMHYQLFTLALK